MTEPAIDIDALIDKLLASERSRTLESPSAKLFWRGGKRYDIEAPTLEGVKHFTNVEADDGNGGDAQSDFEPTFDTWIDGALYENEEEDHQSPNLVNRNVLDDLEHADKTKRRQLVIEVEAMPVEGEERRRLIELLKHYIEEHRDSTDRDELIAVGSAIRKCVALLESSEFGWLATLLESGHRVQPSLDAELEIAKMVFRRYSVSPPEEADPHPDLSDRLAEIASDYLRPRIFSRERFSTVAMLAIQSLLVMRSGRAQEIIEQVNGLPFGWFRRQLRRRMDKVVGSMDPATAAIRELGALVRQIRPE